MSNYRKGHVDIYEIGMHTYLLNLYDGKQSNFKVFSFCVADKRLLEVTDYDITQALRIVWTE